METPKYVLITFNRYFKDYPKNTPVLFEYILKEGYIPVSDIYNKRVFNSCFKYFTEEKDLYNFIGSYEKYPDIAKVMKLHKALWGKV